MCQYDSLIEAYQRAKRGREELGRQQARAIALWNKDEIDRLRRLREEAAAREEETKLALLRAVGGAP